VYETTRLSIEEGTVSPELLESKRGAAMANISWLSSNGFDSLAGDLKEQLEVAEASAAH
jgi:hypothetical protein